MHVLELLSQQWPLFFYSSLGENTENMCIKLYSIDFNTRYSVISAAPFQVKMNIDKKDHRMNLLLSEKQLPNTYVLHER